MNNIFGGYILIARKITESAIWSKPPLYLKVWIYLLGKAQHSDYKKLKRGQLFVSIPEIQAACSWYIGYRKVTPNKDQIYQVIDWLRKPCEQGYECNDKAVMITTTKATHGMLITIENYCVYQNSKLYESNTVSPDISDTEAMREQRLPDNINKNVKNERIKNNILANLLEGEEKILSLLKTVQLYPFDCVKDLEFIRSLVIDFPNRDIERELKDWQTWLIDNPLKKSSNPRTQIRNWLKPKSWQKKTSIYKEEELPLL